MLLNNTLLVERRTRDGNKGFGFYAHATRFRRPTQILYPKVTQCCACLICSDKIIRHGVKEGKHAEEVIVGKESGLGGGGGKARSAFAQTRSSRTPGRPSPTPSSPSTHGLIVCTQLLHLERLHFEKYQWVDRLRHEQHGEELFQKWPHAV